MNYLILIIIGVAGIIIGYNLAVRNARGKEGIDNGLNEKRKMEKEEKKKKVLELVREKNRITNNDVERILDVSDATAERYLNELEKEGIIRQIGDTGKSVYYELNN